MECEPLGNFVLNVRAYFVLATSFQAAWIIARQLDGLARIRSSNRRSELFYCALFKWLDRIDQNPLPYATKCGNTNTHATEQT